MSATSRLAPRRCMLAVLASVTAILSACGGGDGPLGDSVAEQPQAVLPAAALASPEALVRHLASWPADAAGEPARVDGLALPVSDTDDPVTL